MFDAVFFVMIEFYHNSERCVTYMRISYKQWEENYPGYCILRKEGFFYTGRNDTALLLNDILGYKLYEDAGGNTCTGGPDIDKIETTLTRNNISYIVIEKQKIISQYDAKVFDTELFKTEPSSKETEKSYSTEFFSDYIGAKISHIKYGKGTIKSIHMEKSINKDRLLADIDFKNKTHNNSFDLLLCLKNNIIKFEN